MLNIKITKKTQKILSSLQPKHIRQLKEKIAQLRIHPDSHDSKQLIGYPYKRVDVGEYRIIYNVADNTLLIYIYWKKK